MIKVFVEISSHILLPASCVDIAPCEARRRYSSSHTLRIPCCESTVRPPYPGYLHVTVELEPEHEKRSVVEKSSAVGQTRVHVVVERQALREQD